MFRRYKPLVFTALVVAVMSLFWGCSQPDDVITPVFRTEIHLSPERLPSNPPGMIYSLWAAKGTTGDTVYIDKFGFDQTTVEFLNDSSEVRPDSNLFALKGDLYNFSHLFIAIDTLRFDTSHPGPVMLVDEVTNPVEDPIELRFYLSDSLWQATTRYNMQTPSDSNRNSNNGAGIWFCNYRVVFDSIRDTLHLATFSLDSTVLHSLPGGRTDTVSVVDTTNYREITLVRVLGEDTANQAYGLDTILQRVVRFDYVYFHDVDSPWVVYSPRFTYTVGSTSYRYYDVFSQDEFGLIDYSSMGWKYKGWVLSTAINPAAVGQLTPPAWDYDGPYTVFEGLNGGLLTTGTFANIAKPDDGNPYGHSPRVPPFPGEDFLENLPEGQTGPVDLLASGARGTVFVTLEPDNYVFDSTNFPLFVMIKQLPTSRGEVTGSHQVTMRGWMQTDDPLYGFPKVTAAFRRL
jgi:hypothetical protein